MNLFFGKKIIDLEEVLKSTKVYYNVFSIKNDKINKCLINPYPICNQISNETVFIGQPLIAEGFVTKDDYIKSIENIVLKEGRLNYHPHPREKWLKSVNIEWVTFINKLTNEPLEEYFFKVGLPNKIISYNSTALLTLRLMSKEAQINYIPSNHPNFLWMNSFFEENGITNYFN